MAPSPRRPCAEPAQILMSPGAHFEVDFQWTTGGVAPCVWQRAEGWETEKEKFGRIRLLVKTHEAAEIREINRGCSLAEARDVTTRWLSEIFLKVFFKCILILYHTLCGVLCNTRDCRRWVHCTLPCVTAHGVLHRTQAGAPRLGFRGWPEIPRACGVTRDRGSGSMWGTPSPRSFSLRKGSKRHPGAGRRACFAGVSRRESEAGPRVQRAPLAPAQAPRSQPLPDIAILCSGVLPGRGWTRLCVTVGALATRSEPRAPCGGGGAAAGSHATAGGRL